MRMQTCSKTWQTAGVCPAEDVKTEPNHAAQGLAHFEVERTRTQTCSETSRHTSHYVWQRTHALRQQSQKAHVCLQTCSKTRQPAGVCPAEDVETEPNHAAQGLAHF
jgi:hypothetical protein